MKQTIYAENAPKAIGPYCHAVTVGDLVFTSGQLGISPSTGEFVGTCVKCQTKQALENLKAVLGEVGFELQNVIKTTVFLKDMASFSDMNEVYGQYFVGEYPARSCIEVARLPKDGLVEIEVIASKLL